MTSVVLWKEYRQQRALWVVIAVAAVVLSLAVAAVLGRGDSWQAFHDERNSAFFLAVVIVLATIHGLATGALLLAADKENGALDFLDSLTGKRGPLYARKVMAGLFFTLSQSCVLAGMTIGLGFGGWTWAINLPLLSLDGLVWGLLAGALCRSSLTAMLTGIALLVLSWPVTIIVMGVIGTLLRWMGTRQVPGGTEAFLTLGRTAVGLTAGFVSWRIYCRDDLARKEAPPRFRKMLAAAFPQDLRVLLWLVVRQGRPVLIGCLAAVAILAFAVQYLPGLIWPMGTMLLGLACGLAAFAPDQNAGNRFLGAQRLPTGRIWAVKVLFWATATAFFAALTWLLVAVPLQAANPNQWIMQWTTEGRVGGNPMGFVWQFGDRVPLFAIWPLYGFFFGQFFGQVLQRPIIATVVAVIITPLIAALWVPSLIVAGVHYWEVLIIPAILLVTTRLIQWPWVSTRLVTARPMCGVAAAFGLMGLSLAGCFWYRAVKVPDVGAPFDVPAFLKAQSATKLNKSGRLLPEAVTHLVQLENEVSAKMRTLGEPDDLAAMRRASTLLNQVAEHGWPKKDADEIGRWLDELFGARWAYEAQQAAKLPLGILQEQQAPEQPTTAPSYLDHYLRLARLFVVRALQVQAKDDSKAALKHLETALALSRQIANYASGPQLYCGYRMEDTGLTGIQLWVQNIGPKDKALLPALRAILKQHKAEWPDPANAIKASYVAYTRSDRHSLSNKTRFDDLVDFTYRGVPWEKERLDRIVRARVKGELDLIHGVGPGSLLVWWKLRRQKRMPSLLEAIATENGLPPEEGPGSDLSAARWGELVTESWYCFRPVNRWKILGSGQRPEIIAAELVTALVQYEADHDGSPPAKLSDLVPDYLTSVPLDRSEGGSISYMISQGGGINERGEPLRLAPGQAFIMYDDSLGDPHDVVSVPIWPSGKEKKS